MLASPAGAVPPAEAAPAPVTSAWSLPRRIAFRFAFAYLVLYNLPFPINAFPVLAPVSEAFDAAWTAPTLWTGRHVFGLTKDFAPIENGSGDQTFNFVQNFCILALAAIATILWSVLDRRRSDYARLHDWLRTYVRFVLGYTMLSYGMYKVFKSQFPAPAAARLLEPYGDSSPMGLLWTFMGYSTPYTVLAGTAEAVGGLLLWFRRTTTLGALLLLGVIGNVVALNFCYDVPVKLYSSNLWLMALFLLLPDLGRLSGVFLEHRATSAVPLGALFVRPALRRWAFGLKLLLVAFLAYSTATEAWQGMMQYGDGAPIHPFDGVYEVEEFLRNGVAVPPLLSEARRWRYLALSYGAKRMYVRSVDDSYQSYLVKDDKEKKSWTVTSRDDPAKQAVWRYSRSNDGELTVAGTIEGDEVSVRLRRIDANKRFLLLSRGFHWINEAPFNR